MNTIPILFTFDEKLIMPACVCISSLLENAGKDTFYDIFILHGSENGAYSNLQRLQEVYPDCRISFRKVENDFAGAFEIRGITETAYYRLISPLLIPEYDKYLYSDVDVIFREDLSKYYYTDIGDNYFGAVENCSAIRPEMQKYIRSLGLDYKNGYFYSGNLIINAKRILEDGLTSEFRELGKRKFMMQDMDIMNIVCNKRIFSMPPAFCLSVQICDLIINRHDEVCTVFSAEELDYALKNGIVHFNGAKPWNDVCLNMDIWWEYYRKSFVFDEGFSYGFWDGQRKKLDRLSFVKRLKLLVRYPYDRFREL